MAVPVWKGAQRYWCGSSCTVELYIGIGVAVAVQ